MKQIFISFTSFFGLCTGFAVHAVVGHLPQAIYITLTRFTSVNRRTIWENIVNLSRLVLASTHVTQGKSESAGLFLHRYIDFVSSVTTLSCISTQLQAQRRKNRTDKSQEFRQIPQSDNRSLHLEDICFYRSKAVHCHNMPSSVFV